MIYDISHIYLTYISHISHIYPIYPLIQQTWFPALKDLLDQTRDHRLEPWPLRGVSVGSVGSW